MRYRIKFSKVGKMRFIGHLDLLKVFQRAIKRGEIPVSYSKGFNPHQLMGFAIPLPLGMASVGEYLDIEIDGEISPNKIMSSLNDVMPEGIQILDVRQFTKDDRSCATVLEAALYEILLDDKIIDFSEMIKNMFLQNSFEIEKISKRKTKVADIKPDIFSIEEISNDKFTAFRTIISAGSQRNLKPELLVKYIYKYMGKEYEFLKVKYKRIELFKNDNGRFLPL